MVQKITSLYVFLFCIFFISCKNNHTADKSKNKIEIVDNESVTDIQGIIDSSFNRGKGIITSTSQIFGDDFSETSIIGKVDSNKIIISGCLLNKKNLEGCDIYLVRYNIDGSLDKGSFDENKGYIVQHHSIFTTGLNFNDFILQKNKEILISGMIFHKRPFFFEEPQSIFFSKFNPNGKPDEKMKLSYKNPDENSNNYSIINTLSQSNNKFLLIGNANFTNENAGISGGSDRILIQRYDLEGTIDKSFGNFGSTLSNQLQGKNNDLDSHDFIRTSAIQNDGKIIVGGNSIPPYESFSLGSERICCYRAILGRYNKDGSLDSNFGINGYALENFNSRVKSDSKINDISSISIQPDNKIIVGGYYSENLIKKEVGRRQFVLARFDTDGNLDHSFGNAGFVLEKPFTKGSAEEVSSIVIENNGKIIIAGTSEENNEYNYFITKYNHNGKRDFSFGNNGILFLGNNFKCKYCKNINIKLQNNGKLLVFGINSLPLGKDPLLDKEFFIIRYK